jgi:GrpB-like predicted nucleotidyltransferase (UPF0157 family)
MDAVEIVDYDPAWPLLYEAEAARIRAVLDSNLIVGLQHFGSTAIPGLAAKPIIDILIAVRSIADAQAAVIDPLQRLGYAYWSENPKVDRMFFVKGMPPFGQRRTHHVHVTEPTGEMWQQRLAFRDYLKAHPEDAARYGRLKHDLAARHRLDREAYTSAKDHFIADIQRKIVL